MATRSTLINVMSARRRQGGARPEARLRRGRAAAGLGEGAGRFRFHRRSQGREGAAPGAVARAARLRLPDGRKRRHRRAATASIAGSSIRSTAPPISCTACPHFCISIGARARRRDRRGRHLRSDEGRDVLGRERRRAPTSMTGACASRRAGRSTNALIATGIPLRPAWRSAALSAPARRDHGDRRRCAPLRRRRPRPRLCRRRALSTASGNTGCSPGTWPPGWLLVREAGGYISEPDGEGHPVGSGDVLAANDHLHGLLRTTLRQA